MGDLTQGHVRLQPNSVEIDDQARRDGRYSPVVVRGARDGVELVELVELVEQEPAVRDEGGLTWAWQEFCRTCQVVR
jgi:hypothetical protein